MKKYTPTPQQAKRTEIRKEIERGLPKDVTLIVGHDLQASGKVFRLMPKKDDYGNIIGYKAVYEIIKREGKGSHPVVFRKNASRVASVHTVYVEGQKNKGRGEGANCIMVNVDSALECFRALIKESATMVEMGQ